MTDRFNTLTVILNKKTREDDAEKLLEAILCLKGVLSVKGNVSSISDELSIERVRNELGRKIIDIIYPSMDKK